MAEYKTRYSHEQKRLKLAKFNSVYYDGDPNNWKVSRLPNWMNFYGNSLDMELRNESPRYYRKFEQGTIVMVDYGVPIGNELGGKHFGVVLANNDTKFKKKVLVVPLSSHYHRGYVNLGYNLMEEIARLGNERINELQDNADNLLTRLKSFMQDNSNRHFEFSKEEINFFNKNNIDITYLANIIPFDISRKNVKLEHFIDEIKNSNSWEEYPNIFEFVSFIETVFSFQQSILKDQRKFESDIKKLKDLRKKFAKYNKQSFAVTDDIRTISKLRVVKLSHFTISGNTRISSEKMKIIQAKISEIIE